MTDKKIDEKELEKREEKEEKERDEKNWDEKYARDPLGTIVWALIFIWAGVVLLAANFGLLDRIITWQSHMPMMGWMGRIAGAWPLILLGAGVLVLIEVLIRLLVPAYRRPVFGSLFFAILLIGAGLGDLVNWNILWALLLIGLGLSIILRGARKSP